MTDQELEAEQAFHASYAAWRAAGRPLVGPELDAALDALAAWEKQREHAAGILQCSPCNGGESVV